MSIYNNHSEILNNLNPPQLEAVTHTLGPLLVLAGAGSGKTRVLTRRIAYLVRTHRVDPSRILAVTFTNKATEEMRERLKALLGDDAMPLWISTFHSAALRILRHYGHLLSYEKDFIVYDEGDSHALIKKVIRELNIDDKKHHYKTFAKIIDRAKNDLLSPEQYYLQNKYYESQLNADVYDHYQRALRRANAMDFSDLLFNVVDLFSNHPKISQIYQENLHFVLVDEFQDTNKAQYLFLRYITKKHKNVFVVGDDDQSIYAFRGADPQNIIQFSNDFPNTRIIKLEQNYRSSANILEAAHAIIEKNTTRSAKKLWTAADGGERLTTFNAFNEDEEAEFVAEQIKKLVVSGIKYQDIAVFYRTNAQSRALEEALMNSAIPFRIYGGLRFYDRKEIKDIIAYLRLIANENDNQAFQRIVNNPPRGIGAQTVQIIYNTAKQNSSSLLEAAGSLVDKSRSIAAFIKLMNEFTIRLDDTNLSELIRLIVEKTGYGERLKNEDDLASQSRIENIEELRSVASTFDSNEFTHKESLTAFLDRAILSSSNETSCDQYGFIRQKNTITQTETVSLMTLHLAKGLEFPIVFLTGMEEGLLPHHKSKDSVSGVEEERRLCYVGITRAKQKIYLTYTNRRGMFSAGSSFGTADGWREASRFLQDIPNCFLEPWIINERQESLPDDRLHLHHSSKVITSKAGKGIILATADELLESSAKTKVAQQIDELEPLSSDAATPGTEVFHPTFGKGVIESVTGDCCEDPQRAKIRIQFDCFQGTKTLIFGKSKLRQANTTS